MDSLSRFNQKFDESISLTLGLIGASIHKAKNKESTKDVLTHAERNFSRVDET